jgi:UPF0755 protein
MKLSKLFVYLLALMMLAVLCLSTIYMLLEHKVKQSIHLQEPLLFQVKSGQSANSVLKQLYSQGLVTEPLVLKIWLKLDPQLANIKVGTYPLSPNMSQLALFELLSSGLEAQFSIRLIEGLRWRDWLITLQAHPNLKIETNFEQEIQQFLQEIEQVSLEGWLMPETYYFNDQTPSIQIVKRAHRDMQAYLAQAWQGRAFDLPYDNPYQGLIMASIIEKETAVGAERSRISGVFVNRLNTNMRLQTDPTVIYGMGDAFDGDIRRKDLRAATPYNTYVIKGLPPTPIAMPGKLAIDATFHPLTTDEVYFVSKGDGSHKFSVTLKEHNAAVRKYQLNK